MTLADVGYSVSTLWLTCFQRLLKYLASNLLIMSVPDDGYFRRAPSTLNLISTFLVADFGYAV